MRTTEPVDRTGWIWEEFNPEEPGVKRTRWRFRPPGVLQTVPLPTIDNWVFAQMTGEKEWHFWTTANPKTYRVEGTVEEMQKYIEVWLHMFGELRP